MLTIHIKCITFEVLDVMSMYYVLREMISGDYCIEVRILSLCCAVIGHQRKRSLNTMVAAMVACIV